VRIDVATTRQATIRREKKVGDEIDVDEATPRGDVRGVRDPELIRVLGAKGALHQVARPLQRLVRIGRADAAPAHRPAQTCGLNQTGDRAAGDPDPLRYSAATRPT
jgi:hypothetical protein